MQRRRGAAADPVSRDDLARAIERLAGLGSGFGLVTIGGKQFVRSVPTELSTDSNAVIELAEVGRWQVHPCAVVGARLMGQVRGQAGSGVAARGRLGRLVSLPGCAPAAGQARMVSV